jgi:putative CRISPR-associated protein (TIGR02619 family)
MGYAAGALSPEPPDWNKPIMSQHHILTVGISLLTNFARERNLAIDEAAKHHPDIAAGLRLNPRLACAEINSLASRTGFLDKPGCDLAVTLAFTATGHGKLCASLIEKELKRRKVAVHRLPVRGVDAPARNYTPEFAARECAAALADLRQRVCSHIARLRERDPKLDVQLNCTGGYKAECAVLYELGRALHLPVYYLHETFQVAVEFA